MSAAEDDTELRDLLIQNLENSGVLNKLKAEMRAAVFLAMEEQDKVENKTPLINENLKKCLNTKDGHLVASLIMDFLHVFNLDFTLAVFQPEINSLNGLDSRDLVCRELGLSESEVNRNSPLLLELVRRGRHKDRPTDSTEVDRNGNIPKEPTQKQITSAQLKFDSYDKERSGSILKEDLKSVFMDLFPSLNKNMLERFISDELRAADKTFAKNNVSLHAVCTVFPVVDFQLFLGMYKCLFTQCRNVVLRDSDVSKSQSRSPEEKISSPANSKIPRYKGHSHKGQSQRAAKDSEGVMCLGQGGVQQKVSNNRISSHGLQEEDLDLNVEVEEDLDDGDSFFDDPLPKPQKTYGCRSSPIGEKDSPERTNSQKEKMEASGARESPAGSLSEPLRPGGEGEGSSTSEQSLSKNGPSISREKRFRDPNALNEKSGSPHLDDDIEYDDDFNSHRSDLSKTDLSIGEEIEEVSIEGPDNSDKFDETTQDLSVSQLSQSHGADYIEDVA
ncbi:FGFR1 oncogene partner isoform X7 [Channa argus]|uniref:FGFR1 oncogene partner isoform X7 n=1 Tax=Channa argus TaxID=215402 RepID=UPI0035230011